MVKEHKYIDVCVFIDDEDFNKKSVVYKLTFPSDKVYIGITICKLNKRIKTHCHKSLIENKDYDNYKSRAIRKYMTFNVDILYEGDDLNNKEIEFIKQYNAPIRGSVAYSSSVAGRADCSASVPVATVHFREIGHLMESKTGGTNVTSKVTLHFN